MPRAPSVALAAAAAVAVLLLATGSVLGHAQIDTASPGPDSLVETQPEALVVTFTEAVDPAKTTIEVRDPAGAVIAKGGAAQVDPDGLTMTVPLPPLADGRYQVRWTSAALDGHIERGTYTFTVALVAQGSLLPEPSPGESAVASAASPPAVISPAPTASAAAPSVPGSGSPGASGPASSATATASAGPGDPTAGGSGASSSDAGGVLLPIAAALLIVAALAAWFVSRRRR